MKGFALVAALLCLGVGYLLTVSTQGVYAMENYALKQSFAAEKATSQSATISRDIITKSKLTPLRGANEGLCWRFCGSERDVEEILCLLRPLYTITNQGDSFRCIYAYSPLVDGYVFVDFVRINVQIVFSGDTVSVGFPLLLGSY